MEQLRRYGSSLWAIIEDKMSGLREFRIMTTMITWQSQPYGEEEEELEEVSVEEGNLTNSAG